MTTPQASDVVAQLAPLVGNRSLRPVLQRSALGAVRDRPLASIRITNPGYVPLEGKVLSTSELVPDGEAPGRFEGFATRVEATAQAWRRRDIMTAVVKDADGSFHTLLTSWPGRGSAESLRMIPYEHGYAKLCWVNGPTTRRSAGDGPGLSWSERVSRVMDWRRVYTSGTTPKGFFCVHRGAHAHDLRRCLEHEYSTLLAEALGIGRLDVGIVRNGTSSRPDALVSFDLDMHGDGVLATGGISRLPTDRTTPVPRSKITFGPNSFSSTSGMRLIATAIHESSHVSHAEQAIDWLRRWRASRTRASFPDWLRRRRLTDEQYTLVIEQTRGGKRPATETLSHLEGFMATYHAMSITEDWYRFEQVDQGSEFWAHAGHAINDSTIERLSRYHDSLDAAHQRDLLAHARRMESSTRGRLHHHFWRRLLPALE